MKTKSSNIVFFGTGSIAAIVLRELCEQGYRPTHVVTGLDQPKGRGLQLQESDASSVAREYDIPSIKTDRITDDVYAQLVSIGADLHIVADFGCILKERVLAIPPHGTLNVHPSLLPRLRGPSPVRTALLLGEQLVGVTIMLLDADMDHGPILASKEVPLSTWPIKARELESLLAHEGAKLLCDVLPKWLDHTIEAIEQDHSLATFSRKLSKSDGEVDLTVDSPEEIIRKVYALEGWPGTYTYFERNGVRTRTLIIDAHLQNGELVIDVVKPEGKSEMSYADFARAGVRPLQKMSA